ncbi:hypothetical protein GCK32_010637 [Trichostrongylus colubriformis]|uniref:Uncharacterized protein n=1 Tax=Trichostrongylus colubriformis TaxID=6319 RepID=A0AAN8FVR4_TRICO
MEPLQISGVVDRLIYDSPSIAKYVLKPDYLCLPVSGISHLKRCQFAYALLFPRATAGEAPEAFRL